MKRAASKKPSQKAGNDRPNARAPTDMDILFGQTIRRERIARNMTLSELGAALGISHQQLQKYETGSNRVSVGMIVKLSDALQLPVESLFADTVPEPRPDSRNRLRIDKLLEQFDEEELSRVYAILRALKS